MPDTSPDSITMEYSRMTVTMTGSNGFLGWHTRAALRERDAAVDRMEVGASFDLASATSAVSSDRFIHIAGVNRGSENEVHEGNILFAEQAAAAIRHAESPPKVIAFANSIQADNNSVYGQAKARAASILSRAAEAVGASFLDVRLPNLFGEHGRPFYNAVTSTFCHLIARGERPKVEVDRDLTLLHAQDAADLLTGVLPAADISDVSRKESVGGLLRRIDAMAGLYDHGEIPDVSDAFSRDLFNTYRSFTVTSRPALSLTRHADARGSFFEIVRSHGGSGQSSFSTTAPGVTRGDHFHRRKIERFTVLSGSGVIRLRRILTDDVLTIEASGGEPVAVDMPTLWSHSITNTGTDDLLTSFWTNDIFDPNAPDTIPETVLR